jgi:WD40 repeat protein
MQADDGQKEPVVLYEAEDIIGLAIDPRGERLLVGEIYPPRVSLVPLGQGVPRRLPGFTTPAANVMGVAFSADGRLAAAAPAFDTRGTVIRVWDLDSGEIRVLNPCADPSSKLGGQDHNVTRLGFLSDGRLVSTGFQGVCLWDLDKGTSTFVYENPVWDLVESALSANRRSLLFFSGLGGDTPVDLFYHDLESGSSHAIASHGDRVTAVALNPSGTLAVTGDVDGVVRVGAVTGGEPHLLLGHQQQIWDLDVSPDGRWIASGDTEGTIRIWPMPEVDQPPLHTLPYESLLADLRSLTNLRTVEDPTSPTGYKVEPGPFQGWEEVPTW